MTGGVVHIRKRTGKAVCKEGFVENKSLLIGIWGTSPDPRVQQQMNRELFYTRVENARPSSTMGTTCVSTLMSVATCQVTQTFVIAPNTSIITNETRPYES